MHPNAITQFKQTIEIFGALAPATWSQIEPHLNLHSLKKGETLLRFDEIPSAIYFIVEGIFRSYFLDEQGKTYTKNLFFQNELMGSMPALIRHRPTTLEIEALTDATLIALPFDLLKELMGSDPTLQSIYIAYLEEHWVVEQEEIERSLVMEDAMIRYLKLLEKEPDLGRLIPSYHIANHLGITPTQLSRIRKKLKSQPM